MAMQKKIYHLNLSDPELTDEVENEVGNKLRTLHHLRVKSLRKIK